MTSDEGGLSTDALFQILGNARRRFIIRHLYSTNQEANLNELAALIAAKEEGTTPEAVTNAERQRVYVSLYQTHLPTLIDSGLVTYNENQRLLSVDRSALEEHCQESTVDAFLVGYATVAVIGLLASVALSIDAFAASGQLANALIVLLSVALSGLVAAQYVRYSRTVKRECLLSIVD